jgi:hypothetical protein
MGLAVKVAVQILLVSKVILPFGQLLLQPVKLDSAVGVAINWISVPLG